jgi:hypothetical protein
MIINIETILPIIQYLAMGAGALGVILFPVWLARYNGLDNYYMMHVMVGAIVFGWTVIGWLVALYFASNIKYEYLGGKYKWVKEHNPLKKKDKK